MYPPAALNPVRGVCATSQLYSDAIWKALTGERDAGHHNGCVRQRLGAQVAEVAMPVDALGSR